MSLLLWLLLAVAPARADLYLVASLDWFVEYADPIVLGEVVQVSDTQATVRIDRVIDGAVTGSTLKVNAWSRTPHVGDTGLYALTGPPSAPVLHWIGHPRQGAQVVLDRDGQVIDGLDAQIAAIQTRAAWYRAHPVPPDARPVLRDIPLPSESLQGHDVPSGLLVPPDPPR